MANAELKANASGVCTCEYSTINSHAIRTVSYPRQYRLLTCRKVKVSKYYCLEILNELRLEFDKIWKRIYRFSTNHSSSYIYSFECCNLIGCPYSLYLSQDIDAE